MPSNHLWFRIHNLAFQGGREVMESEYYETSSVYVIGYALAHERLLTVEGAFAELDVFGVHIIAHSMGNRGLARAFQRLETILAETGITYGQIILAAPDIDVELFRQLASVYARVSERTTLYASARDRALGMSKRIQHSDRAGFFPPITIVPGIDTIEVSNIDVTRLDLGHGVYAESEALLYDIGQLLRDCSPPDRRQRLAQAASSDGTHYWTLRR
jgi:esterase/lipase superfamily enzyme